MEYDSFEELTAEYDQAQIVAGNGETADAAYADAVDDLPGNTTNLGEFRVEVGDNDYFAFVGYELEEQEGGGPAASDAVSDMLDPR